MREVISLPLRSPPLEHHVRQPPETQLLTDFFNGIVALSTPAPKSLLIPARHAVRAISTSAEKKAEVPVAQRSGGGPAAPIPRVPRREVPLPSQEAAKGVVQYAL